MTLPRLTLANAHFVTPFLAVGGDLAFDNAIAAAQAIELVNGGITHVLDVRQECDDTELWSYVPEVTYRWDGIDDAGQKVPASWFEDVTRWARDAITSGGTVLTHCHMGINRGPSVGYAVLLRLGWDPPSTPWRPSDLLARSPRSRTPRTLLSGTSVARAPRPESGPRLVGGLRNGVVRTHSTSFGSSGRFATRMRPDVVRIIRSIRHEDAS
jgi:hypothetical protein